ncbi:hypothetical protein Agub_g1551, partial [Astrephomene gubernaculifera]
LGELFEFLSSQSWALSPTGLLEAVVAICQMEVLLPPDMAARFRGPLARCLPSLAPRGVLAVLAAGPSVGLEPPSKEVLGVLAGQVGRMAEAEVAEAGGEVLGPAAAVEVAYEVLRWLPEVVGGEEAAEWMGALKEGLQPLLSRLAQVGPGAAPKLAMMLPSLGLLPPVAEDQQQGGQPGQQQPAAAAGYDPTSPSAPSCLSPERTALLAPLVDAIAAGLAATAANAAGAATGGSAAGTAATADGSSSSTAAAPLPLSYDGEQLGNAVLGLSLAGAELPEEWVSSFMEVSQPQLPACSPRALVACLTGLALQGAQPPRGYVGGMWRAVRALAAPPRRGWELAGARGLLAAAGRLGVRPDADTMQAVLDSALLRYRESPDPEGLAELVQVLASFHYVPRPGWAAE